MGGARRTKQFRPAEKPATGPGGKTRRHVDPGEEKGVRAQTISVGSDCGDMKLVAADEAEGN